MGVAARLQSLKTQTSNGDCKDHCGETVAQTCLFGQIGQRRTLECCSYNIGAHNVYYVKLPMKVLYFTIHIHTQINQYVVISDFPPVSVDSPGTLLNQQTAICR